MKTPSLDLSACCPPESLADWIEKQIGVRMDTATVFRSKLHARVQRQIMGLRDLGFFEGVSYRDFRWHIFLGYTDAWGNRQWAPYRDRPLWARAWAETQQTQKVFLYVEISQPMCDALYERDLQDTWDRVPV